MTRLGTCKDCVNVAILVRGQHLGLMTTSHVCIYCTECQFDDFASNRLFTLRHKDANTDLVSTIGKGCRLAEQQGRDPWPCYFIGGNHLNDNSGTLGVITFSVHRDCANGVGW